MATLCGLVDDVVVGSGLAVVSEVILVIIFVGPGVNLLVRYFFGIFPLGLFNCAATWDEFYLVSMVGYPTPRILHLATIFSL